MPNTNKDRSKLLLESAIHLLMEPTETAIHIINWRTTMNEQFIKVGRRATDPVVPILNTETIMPEANAKAKKSEQKAATKSLAARGITAPKHKPGESAPGVKAQWPETKSGVDKASDTVVHSKGSSTTTQQENSMTEDTKALPKAQADKEAAAKAKIEAKEAKAKAAADKKAQAEQEKKVKAEERAALAAQTKEAKALKAAQAAEARKATDPEGKRTYFGSMLSLSDRVKSGAYTKGINGQLRSNDAVASALEVVHPQKVVELLLKVLGLEANPYEKLNYGQQSMNLRNKLRGAIRADEGMGAILVAGTDTQPPVRITIERLKTLRDEGGYATEEAAVAQRKADKEEKAKVAAAAKAKKDAEKSAPKAAAAASTQPAA